MNKKLITIITPTYNCADKIEKTIVSVLAQDNTLFEYIIIDGGSNDGTMSVIEKYSSEIKLISEKDRGIYDAMNKGIGIASGNYLYFLGAGDTLIDGILGDIKKELHSSKYHFLYGDVYMCDKNSIYNGVFNKYKIAYSNICHQAIFYEKHIFEILGTYDLKYQILADHHFNIKCFGDKRINRQYIPNIIANYEGGGTSFNGDNNFYVDQKKLIRETLGFNKFLYFIIRTNILFILDRINAKKKVKKIIRKYFFILKGS